MDTKKLNLIMNLLKFGLVAVGVIASLLIINGPNMEATVEDQEAFRDGGSLGFAINYTIFVIIVTIAFVLLFFVIQLITNTKKTAISILSLLIALVIYLIFLGLGNSDTNESLNLAEDVQVDSGTLLTTTAGLFTAIAGLAIGVLVWILSPLMGRYRK